MPRDVPHRRRSIRSWMQFSVRSMLILTTVAAVAVWFFLRPQPHEEELTGGLRIRVPVREFEVSSPAGFNDVVGVHFEGPCVVYREDGRVFCRGRYAKDQPDGHWTFYHANGGKSLAGKCRNGFRIGTWVGWHENGRKHFEVEHGEPQTDESYPAFTPKFKSPKSSNRHGTACAWWPNGNVRFQGRFAENQRQGHWAFWDETGIPVASGDYRKGRRHGNWTFTSPGEDEPRAEHYVMGHVASSRSALLAMLAENLESEDGWEQRRAVNTLGELGRDGAMLLATAVRRSDSAMQLVVLRTLQNMGAEATVAADAVRELADAATSESARTDALVTLFLIEDTTRKETMAQLVEITANSQAGERAARIAQLARIGRAGWPLLEKLAASDESDQRRTAFEILAAQTIGPDADHVLGFEPAIDMLLRLQDGEHADIAKAAREVHLELLEQKKMFEEFRNNPNNLFGGVSAFVG